MNASPGHFQESKSHEHLPGISIEAQGAAQSIPTCLAERAGWLRTLGLSLDAGFVFWITKQHIRALSKEGCRVSSLK